MSKEFKEYIRGVFGVVISLLLVIIAIFLMGYIEKVTHEEMDNRADIKAYCDSIGGKLGGDKCYKDGVEQR